MFDVSTDYEADKADLENATQAVLDHVQTLRDERDRLKRALEEIAMGTIAWERDEMIDCAQAALTPAGEGRMSEHQSKEVQQALTQLNDAICAWERTTNRQSVLILREDGGFIHRSVSGKPYHNDVFPTDEELFKQVRS